MLERWTVDAVADEIEAQFMPAAPDRKLVRRFYNEGRRHGRRLHPFGQTRHFLESAVAVATEKIAEEYVDAEQAIEARLAEARSRTTTVTAGLEALGAPAPDGVDDGPEGDAAIRSGGGAPAAGGRAPDMAAARRRLRARSAAAVAASRAAARRDEHKQLERDLMEATEVSKILEDRLRTLADPYRQRVKSCHDAGHLLWARYRSGYEVQRARRWREPRPTEPLPGLDPVRPAVLGSPVAAPATAGA